MNLEELGKRKDRANKLSFEGANDFDRLRRDKIAQATKLIDEELAPEKEKVDRLRQEAAQAARAVEDKLIELAREGNQTKWALGSKLQKTIKKHHGYGYRSEPETIYGILEVVTRETQFPDNTAHWNRPLVGSIIVRLCTKDGKPGKKFVKYTDYEKAYWKPAEDPSEPNS